MALLTLIKNWRETLIGLLGAATLMFLVMFKYRGAKIDKLEDEVKANDKAKEIRDGQKLAIAKIESSEKDEILKGVNGNVKKTKSERIDTL